MAKPGNILLPPIMEGTHWQGFTISIEDDTGEPPATALASVAITFRRDNKHGELGRKITSTDDEITIVSAANWQATVPPIVLGLSPGKYHWDMRTVDAAGITVIFAEGMVPCLQAATTDNDPEEV